MNPVRPTFRPPLARPRLLALGLLLPALAAVAPAQSTGYSDEFDASGINRRVFGVGTWNGELYAGGPFEFLTGDGQPNRIARFDGQEWRDVGGGLGSGNDGEVRDFVEYGGELVAAGRFGVAGQNVFVDSIARWNGSRWAPLGGGLTYAGLPGTVFALEVFQGELYAGGQFDLAGGQPIDSIARWDGAQWRPVGGGVAGSSTSKVLTFHTDGQVLYVGGEFATAGGQPARNVAAWDGSSWRGFGVGLGAFGSGVHALALYQGTLYAGGTFGGSGTTTLQHVGRWDAASQSWQPLGFGIPDGGRTSQVDSLTVYQGELWVIGIYGYVDAASFGQGLYASGIASWNGSRWRSTGGGLYRASFGGDASGICSMVWDGRLVVGGEFDHAGPLDDHDNNVVSQNIISWDGTKFGVLGEGLGLGDGTSGLLRWNDSLWAVENHHYAGSVVSPAVARFDGARWHTVGPFDPRTDIDDAIVFQNALHVVGDLWFADGRRMSGVIRYDGSTWTSLGGPTGGTLAVHGGELYGGGLGGVQRLVSGTWTRLPSLFGYVETMQSFAGNLFIGGSSMRLSAGAPTTNLLVWDGSSLTPVGGGIDGAVTALHVHNGELWIGGRFQNPSPLLARHDGTQVQPFSGPQLAGADVRALETLRGQLYISGGLGVVGGTFTTLAVWDGANLTALGEGPNAPASSLLADEDTGELWIGGGFFLCDGLTAAGLTIWRAETPWQDLGHALPRSNGVTPVLRGFGDLRPNEALALRANGLAPNQPAVLAVGNSRIDVPAFGGLLVPAPVISVPAQTDSAGALRVVFAAPPAVPAGVELFAQAWGAEVALGEVSSTNAVVGR